MNFHHLSVAELLELQAEGPLTIADIRDPNSFSLGHIEQAVNLNQLNVEQFIADSDMDQPLVVCCYHGHSSQPTAQFFVERGFDLVYSLDGGYEAWQQHQQKEN